MARADEIRARYEAELKVADLEDELVALKEAGADLRECKDRLREARQAFRLSREGDAATRSSTIQVTTMVSEG